MYKLLLIPQTFSDGSDISCSACCLRALKAFNLFYFDKENFEIHLGKSTFETRFSLVFVVKKFYFDFRKFHFIIAIINKW